MIKQGKWSTRKKVYTVALYTLLVFMAASLTVTYGQLQTVRTILNDVWDKANHQLMTTAGVGAQGVFETEITIFNDVWDQANHMLRTSGGGGGGGAPSTATYITQTADGGLSAEQALSSLSSGIMRVATTTGAITALTDSAGIAANVSDETGTGVMVFGTAPTFTTSVAVNGTITGTSASASALAIGRLGATTPGFVVDASAGTAVTGVKITAGATGVAPIIAAVGETNTGLTLSSAGTGAVTLVTPANSSFLFNINGSTRFNLSSTQVGFIAAARSSGSSTAFTYTAGTDTTLTAGTEVHDWYLNLARNRQHASNTTVALDRFFRISSPTETFASATGTVTYAALFSLDGPPTAGTNAAITTSAAALIQTRALTSVTTGIGLDVQAPTGATNNHALRLNGHMTTTGTAPAIGGSCGTSPSIAGTDMAGKVTTGSVAPTSCTVTFATAWQNAPACQVVNETTANLARTVSTTTTVVLSGTFVAGDVLAYTCIGYS